MKTKKVTKEVFLNPFDNGVTYDAFLKSIPKGFTVDEYCKGKLKDNELQWLKVELNNYKNK